jgi:hypothetical protein
MGVKEAADTSSTAGAADMSFPADASRAASTPEAGDAETRVHTEDDAQRLP